jgi:hypothetical protein
MGAAAGVSATGAAFSLDLQEKSAITNRNRKIEYFM